METTEGPIQRRLPNNVIRKGLGEFLPTSVQKSYFMLSDAERNVLNRALEKYRPNQSEPISVGGSNLLKPALRLMSYYRLVVEEIKDSEVTTSYRRWVDAVQVSGAENQEVYLAFSPRFERIWLESKKRLMGYAAQKPANIGLRSPYALRLYSWAKKAHFAGAASESARIGLGKRCGWKYHPGSAIADLGEPASKSIESRDCGNQ
jgi:hypothetical protein